MKPKETIFTTGDAYFSSLLNDIATAHQSIDLETYIFYDDFLGEKIATALGNAAHRGVKIRILVDGAGTPNWGGNLTQRLENAGIQTRIFHPFPWRFWQWSYAVIKQPFLLKMIYLFLKINSRNHRKIFVIDKNIAYVGSANIAKCHLSQAKGGENWRDNIVRLENVDTQKLTTAFEQAWNHLPPKERIKNIFQRVIRNPIFRLNNSRHQRRVLYKDLLKRIEKTKQRIWITNAYFVPDHVLLKKLCEAGKRNLDVRILLPEKSDIFLMPWASESFYQSLLKAGIRIFEYYQSMLHAKTLIIDDWFLVGSSNLNHRSLLHDLEIDVNIRELNSKKIIENQFLVDMNHAKEITLTQKSQRPWYQRLLGRLILYIKYWI